MEKKPLKKLFVCRVLQMLLLLFVGHRVSSESKPDLGIFGISFEIVLSNQPTDDSLTTVALATHPTADVATSVPTQSDTRSASSATTPSVTSQHITTSPPVTQPPGVTDKIGAELYDLLPKAFASTIAYQSTTKPIVTENTEAMLTYLYDVIYDKTKLNEASMLTNNSEFIEQLRDVTELISTWPQNFTAAFSIDDSRTRHSMTSTIDTLNEQFADETWLCTGSKCPANDTFCRKNETGSNETGNSVVCVDKCQDFEAGSSCTKEPSVSGVYLQGICALDSYGNPYCDCGKSPGDVMNNFYDGKQCVSVTFIVAMAASAGGLFFILWLITLCVLVCNGNRSMGKGSSRKSSSTDFTANSGGYHEAYHNNELGQRTKSKDYASHGGPLSSHTNNAYDVTGERDEEFKSIRL